MHNCNFSKYINVAKQSRHILGEGYKVGRSILEVDAQILLDGFHSGSFKTLRIINENKRIVDFGKNIGTFFKDGVKIGPTKYGQIINSTTGVHIIQANPVQW